MTLTLYSNPTPTPNQAFPDMQFQILEQSVQGEDQVYTPWLGGGLGLG